MTVLKRPPLYVVGVALAWLTVFMDARPAESRPTTVWDLLQGCGERVVELEAEVERLRAELRQVRVSERRPAQRSARSGGELCLSSGSDGDAQCVSVPECSVPFDVSASGVKRFKPECLQALESLSTCDLPYEFDSRGVKSFKRSCL